LGAGGADGAADSLALVAAEIVHDDEVTAAQRGREDLLDINLETLAVDRTIDQPGSVNAVMTQGGQEGHGLPAAMRNACLQPLTAQSPAAPRCHFCLGPCLVNEDQAFAGDPPLIPLPLRPPASDITTIALAGGDAFF